MSIELKRLELKWDEQKERFTMTCFDDDTCRKIDESSENIRGFWAALNQLEVYGEVGKYVYKRYKAAPVQNTDTVVKIFLELARTSVRELNSLQKKTMLKALEWGMDTNHTVLHCDLEEALIYFLAEKIANQSFCRTVMVEGRNGKFEWNKWAKELLPYCHIDGEISARYHSNKGRSGRLYNPYTLKPRGW